ncbi:MAG: DUF3987 domain-containing protein [bacterium]
MNRQTHQHPLENKNIHSQNKEKINDLQEQILRNTGSKQIFHYLLQKYGEKGTFESTDEFFVKSLNGNIIHLKKNDVDDKMEFFKIDSGEIWNPFELAANIYEVDIFMAMRQICFDLNIDILHPLFPYYYPYCVFPKSIKNLMEDTNNTLGYPYDYTGTAILCAASIAIGLDCIAVVKNGWKEVLNIYSALVGKPGANKSHPLSLVMKPLTVINQRYMEEYQKNKLLLVQDDKDSPERIKLNRIIVSDVTYEAVLRVLNENTKGVGLYVDELVSWVSRFLRYNSSNEQEVWNTMWSGKQVNKDRADGSSITISKPKISICGTIQPGVLSELTKNNRGVNGFIDRILFAYPFKMNTYILDDKQLDTNLIQPYEKIINKLHSGILVNSQKRLELKLTINSFNKFKDWQNNHMKILKSDQLPNSIQQGYSKLVNYVPRIAAILQMLYWSDGEGDCKEIKDRAMEGAIELIEYHRICLIKVHRDILAFDTNNRIPKELLNEIVIKLYKELDSLRKVAEILGIGKSTVSNIINGKS